MITEKELNEAIKDGELDILEQSKHVVKMVSDGDYFNAIAIVAELQQSLTMLFTLKEALAK